MRLGWPCHGGKGNAGLSRSLSASQRQTERGVRRSSTPEGLVGGVGEKLPVCRPSREYREVSTQERSWKNPGDRFERTGLIYRNRVSDWGGGRHTDHLFGSSVGLKLSDLDKTSEKKFVKRTPAFKGPRRRRIGPKLQRRLFQPRLGRPLNSCAFREQGGSPKEGWAMGDKKFRF